MLIVVVGLSSNITAQEEFGGNINQPEKSSGKTKARHQQFDVGFGVGLDYGGIAGVNVLYAPFQHMGIFASGGYYLVSLGWQTGLRGYFVPRNEHKSFRPFINVSYGTNRFILVDDAPQYNQSYPGFSAGAGFELRFGWLNRHGLNLQVIYSQSNANYRRDLDYLNQNTSFSITKLPAVTIAFGYQFAIF